MSLSSEPPHLTVATGTPEFVTSWAEVLVAPRTPECSCHTGHQCNMHRSPWCAPCLTLCTSFLQTLSFLTQAHPLHSLVLPLFSLLSPYLELFLAFSLFPPIFHIFKETVKSCVLHKASRCQTTKCICMLFQRGEFVISRLYCACHVL